MARFTVQGPDGSKFEIEGPDDATDDEISEFAEQQFVQPEIDEPTVRERSIVLPLAEMSNGSFEFAWPGFLKPTADAAQRYSAHGANINDQFMNQWAAPETDGGQPISNDVGQIAGEAGLLGVGATFKQMPSVARAFARRNPRPQGTPTGRALANMRADQADIDLRAFEGQGVRAFSPAFMDGPGASIGKQLTETPIIGSPLRANLDETFADASLASNRVSEGIYPGASYEGAGRSVQTGLDRFRTQGLEDLEPSVLRRLGIDPNAPVQRRTQGGRAQMQRLQQTAPQIQAVTGGRTATSRGNAAFGLPDTLTNRRTTRTTVEDLDDNQLHAVIRAPSQRTSFAARSQALYERAWRRLPPLMRSNDTANGNLVPTARSGAVARRILETQADTGIDSGASRRYGEMLRRLENVKSNHPIARLRAMRTEIGRDLSNFGLYDMSLDRQQLNALYGALSDDIQLGIQDLAARAARDGQPPEVVRNAVQALRDMQVADRLFRAGQQRMDLFARQVGQDNPQAVARAFTRAASEGGAGNMRQFRTAMQVLRPEERSQFAALVVREMGHPLDSARGITQEVGFSPTRFATAYTKMSPEARNILFSHEHQRALEQLFRVSDRLAHVEAQTNTSRSGTNALNLGGAASGLAAFAAGDVTTPIVIGGGGLATSYLMSRPETTRWLIGFARLRANVRNGTARNTDALFRHIERLASMAERNPALLPIVGVVREDAEEEGAR